MQEPQGININKKRGSKECTAPLHMFRAMLATLLKGGGGSAKVAADGGYPSEARSLRRYAAEIRAGSALLQVQLEKAAMVERKSKVPPSFEARRLFTADELLYFERTLIKYGELGWPMDYSAIQRLFSKAANEMGRVDWKTGQPYAVSLTYVRDFVKNRPALKAYKLSNIDPMRAKKATLSVCICSCS